MYRSNCRAVSDYTGRAVSPKAFSADAGTTSLRIVISCRRSLAAICVEHFTAFSRHGPCHCPRRSFRVACYAVVTSDHSVRKTIGADEVGVVWAAALSFCTNSPSTAYAAGRICRAILRFIRSVITLVSLERLHVVGEQGRKTRVLTTANQDHVRCSAIMSPSCHGGNWSCTGRSGR